MSFATFDHRRSSIVRRSYPRISVILVATPLLLTAWRFSGRREERVSLPPEGQLVGVSDAIHGDTLLLEDGHRVRLIGVRAFEGDPSGRVPGSDGDVARAHLQQLVSGKQVTLEFDRERRDDSGRILAYVSLGGRMLNEEMIAAGFCQAEIRSPYRGDRKQFFQNAEARAKAGRLGRWSRAAP